MRSEKFSFLPAFDIICPDGCSIVPATAELPDRRYSFHGQYKFSQTGIFVSVFFFKSFERDIQKRFAPTRWSTTNVPRDVIINYDYNRCVCSGHDPVTVVVRDITEQRS